MQERDGNVARALDTIVRSVVDPELESIRRSVEELRGELSERLEADRESREQALVALEDRLRSELEATRTYAGDRVEATREALGRDIRETDRELKEQLDGLACKLATLEQGLRQQVETSDRLSSVLSNLATIFSGDAAQGTAPRTSEVEGRTELESALDKVFPASS